jgi:predicted  nucleic acid-binding Zn-ribbon protein
MSNCIYNPIPPRVWSRVQNQCTFIEPGSTYDEAFIPLTKQVVSQAQADYESKQIYKGNILQYKGNSARLTKSQKYSQLARMAGPNRTKVFATQSQTYTNPNTTGLLRVGSATFSFPNQIVGAPNNISGPFAYGIPNPDGCLTNTIQDGGNLVCGTLADPCTGEIYKQGPTTATVCNPSSASDVPGSSVLCWNNKVQTWFPRQRYTMNNSGNKWPINYKGLVSALKPSNLDIPILQIDKIIPYLKNTYFIMNTEMIDANEMFNANNMIDKDVLNSKDVEILYDIYISWKYNTLFPVDKFNLYINDVFYKTVSNNTSSYIMRGKTNQITTIAVTSALNFENNVIESDIRSGYNKVEITSFPVLQPDPEPPSDPSNSSCDLTDLNNLLSIIALKVSYGLTKMDNMDSVLNAKIDNINSSINTKIDDINTEIKNVSSEIENVNSTINTKIDSVNSYINNKIEDVNSSINNKIDSVSSSIDNKIDNVNSSINNKIDNVNSSINNKIDNVNSSINNKIDNVNSSINNKIDNVNSSINTKIDVVNCSINNKIDNVNAKIDNVNSSINNKIDNVSSSINTKIDVVNFSINNKIDNVGMKIDVVSSSTNTKIDNVSNKIDDVSSSTNTKIDNISTKIDNVSSSINTKIDALNCSINTKIDNVSSSINTKIDSVSSKIDNTNSKIDNISTKIDNTNTKIDNINTNMNHHFAYLEASFNLLNQKMDIQTENIENRLDTIYSSIANVMNTATSIFDKVSLLKNCCDCSSNYNDFRCNCTFYNSLFNTPVITQINNYVSEYIETMYEDTTTYITIDVYNELNIGLLNLEDYFKNDASCCFFNIIDIYRNMLNIVKSAYDNKNLAKTTLINAENWKNDSIILRDNDKLQEYINNLSKNMYFTSVSISSAYATLKPKYQIYIQLYGLPENLMFDPSKLSNIIRAMEDYVLLYEVPINDQYDVECILKIISTYSDEDS